MLKKDPLQIIVFQTYGTSMHLYLKGRAIEDEIINLEHKSIFKAFINSWKRFETDEIRFAELIIRLPDGSVFSTKADSEGYFLIDESLSNLITLTNSNSWLNYEASYESIHLDREIQSDNKFRGKMLIPSLNASFGVISDIDDTILHTGVTSLFKWKAVFNTLLITPQKRKALEGTAKFYEKLHQGKTSNESNPIFYVSNSPWNLYRYLELFLKRSKFPTGPILLRDIRTPFDKTPKPELAHKYHEIYNILKTYPDLKFILIGDSGEHDADIYLNVVEKYPNRIAAIYLVDVNHKRKRERIKSLFENYDKSPFLLVSTSEQAVEHARSHGFI